MRDTSSKKILFAAAVLVAAVAQAAQVEASLTGLLQARPVAAEGEAKTVVPLYALMSLNASGMSVPMVDDIRVGVGAWGRAGLVGGEGLGGDVDLAFVSGKMFSRHLSITLGRQFRSGGAFRALHLDGLTVDVTLPMKLGITAFGGVPVIPRFALARGDAVWGGRLYWRPTWNSEVGASYLELMDHGYMARRDVALDGRAELLSRRLAVSALGVLSLAEGRLAELDISPRFKVSEKVELYGSFRQASPDLFLSRTSIFSTFADVNRIEGVLGVAYDPTWRFSASADARVIRLTNQGPNGSAGVGYEAQAVGSMRVAKDTRLTLTAVRLGLPTNGYTRVRLAGGQGVGKLMLSLDLDAAFLDNPLNGATQSLTAQATARLPLPASLDLVLSGLAGTDPFFQQRFELMARLVYTFKMRSETTEESK